MKLDPELSAQTLREHLAITADNVYGRNRTAELADQIEHLSRMLAGVARMELDLTEAPLPGPVHLDRRSS